MYDQIKNTCTVPTYNRDLNKKKQPDNTQTGGQLKIYYPEQGDCPDFDSCVLLGDTFSLSNRENELSRHSANAIQVIS